MTEAQEQAVDKRGTAPASSLQVLQIAALILSGVAATLAATIFVWAKQTSYVTTLLAVTATFAGVLSLLFLGDSAAWRRRLILGLWRAVASTVSRVAMLIAALTLMVTGLAFVMAGMRYQLLTGLISFPPDSAKEEVTVVIKTSPHDPGTRIHTITGDFEGRFLREEQLLISAESEHYFTPNWAHSVPGDFIALQLVPRNPATSAEQPQQPNQQTLPVSGSLTASRPTSPSLSHAPSPIPPAPELVRQSSWMPVHGNWQFSEGNATQLEEDAHPGLAVVLGSETASELTCDARRISGDDGFSVIVSYERENLAAWWDIGGYGGTKSIAEFSVPDSGVFYMPQTDKPFMIETGRWYAIHLERKGSHVLGTVNGGLLLDINIPDRISSKGKLGFRTWSSRMQFKNVSVR